MQIKELLAFQCELVLSTESFSHFTKLRLAANVVPLDSARKGVQTILLNAAQQEGKLPSFSWLAPLDGSLKAMVALSFRTPV